MEIELVEFYKQEPLVTKDTTYLGTIHIYIVDFDVDLRMITVARRNKTKELIYILPFLAKKHKDSKKMFRIPYLNFRKNENHVKLIRLIHEKSWEYIEKCLSE